MKKRFSNIRSLLLQMAVVILLFLVALYGLWRVGLVSLPSFLEELLTTDKADTQPYVNESYTLFEYVRDADETETDVVYPVLSAENLTLLLSELAPYETYFWSCETTVYGAGYERSAEINARISGSKYHVETSDASNNTRKVYICDGEKTSVTVYRGPQTESTVYARGLQDFYSDAGLVSVASFADADFPNGNCDIRTIENNGYRLVSIVYEQMRGNVTVRNQYMLSLDYGIVLFAECYENDKPVYTMKTTSVYPLTTFDEELFRVE